VPLISAHPPRPKLDAGAGLAQISTFNDALWTGMRSAAQVVTSFATATADGVLFNFGTNGRLLLQRVTSTAGLAALIEIY